MNRISRIGKKEDILMGGIFLLMASLTLVLSLIFLNRYRWALPHSDQWLDLAIIKNCIFSFDSCTLKNIFIPHNQHFIVLTRIFHFLEYRFFQGNNVFLSTFCFLLLLGLLWILYRQVITIFEGIFERTILLFFSIIFILNPANIFNNLHSFNLQWPLCFILGNVILIDFLKRSSTIHPWQILIFLILMVTCGGGLAILPALAVVALLSSNKKSAWILICLTPLVAGFYIYLASQYGNVLSDITSEEITFENFCLISWRVLFYTLVLSGSIYFQYSEWVSFFVGIFIVIIFFINFYMAIKLLRTGKDEGKRIVFILGVAIFSLGMMLETAVARPLGTPDYRFCMQSTVFWFANAVLLYFYSSKNMLLGGKKNIKLLAQYFIPAFFGIFTLLLADITDGRYRFLANKNLRTQHAYLSGLDSVGVINEAYAYMPDFLRVQSNRDMMSGMEFVRKHNLGIFAKPLIFEKAQKITSTAEVSHCSLSDMKFWKTDNPNDGGASFVAGTVTNTDGDMDRTFYITDSHFRVIGFGFLYFNPLFVWSRDSKMFNTPLSFDPVEHQFIHLLFVSKTGKTTCLSQPVYQAAWIKARQGLR